MTTLRRRLREPDPVVPLAGAPAGSRAPNGSAPIRCCRLAPPERDFTWEPGARGATPCLATEPRRRPRSASLLFRAVVTQRLAPPTRVESSSGGARRIAFTGVTASLIEDTAARPAAPRVGLLAEVAAARCVETERANPTCQRAPGPHGDVRAPGAPGSRERRASRRVARFSRPLREGAGVINRYPSEAAASDAPGARASTGLATDGGARDPSLASPRNTRERLRGSAELGAPSVDGSARAPGRLLPIDVRPEHARERPDFPAHPERSRAGAVGHGGHGR